MVTAKKRTTAEAKKRRTVGISLVVGAYVILAAVLILAVHVRSNDVERSKELACQATLDNKELIAYIVGNTQNPESMPTEGLPPELVDLIEASKENQRKFLELVEEALLEPVEICEEVGIESRVDLPEPTPPTTAPPKG